MISISPIITIVTPFYNTCSIFHQTIQSIYDQSIIDWEWIIINDGSNDHNSLFILDQLKSEDDPRIKIINLPINIGLPGARNKGIQEASANFIFFIDSDDLLQPSALEKFYLFLSTNKEFDFVNSYVRGFGDQDYYWKGGFHEGALFLKENRNTSCFMARKEVFEKVLFDDTLKQGCEDWDFWVNCASKNLWGFTIPEFLFYYRRVNFSKWKTLAGKTSLKIIQNNIFQKYASIIAINGFPNPVFESYRFGNIDAPLTIINHKKKKSQTLICLFPWFKIGGVDKFNLDILKGLKVRGWEIIIITTKGSDHPWEEYFAEVTTDIFHFDNLGPQHKHNILLNYFIESFQPDILFISNSIYGYFMLPYIKKKFPFLFIVDFTHCEETEWYSGGYPFFSALYSKFLNKSYVTSQHLEQWVIKNGSNPKITEVCYIGVDINFVNKNEETRNKIRQDLNLQITTTLILYVARITEQKQPAVLAKSLELLYKNYQNFHCVIIGSGPDEIKLKKLIKEYNLQKQVTILGGQHNDVVLKFMDAADIFFLPSAYEGIALSIFESMAKRLPIISANVGGQAELVKPQCGYLVHRSTLENEAVEYSQHLEFLCNNPTTAIQMGLNGRKRVEQYFNLQNTIDQMDAGLKDLLLSNKVVETNNDNIDNIDLTIFNELRRLQLQNENLTFTLGQMQRFTKINIVARKVYFHFKRWIK